MEQKRSGIYCGKTLRHGRHPGKMFRLKLFPKQNQARLSSRGTGSLPPVLAIFLLPFPDRRDMQ